MVAGLLSVDRLSVACVEGLEQLAHGAIDRALAVAAVLRRRRQLLVVHPARRAGVAARERGVEHDRLRLPLASGARDAALGLGVAQVQERAPGADVRVVEPAALA